MKVSGFLYNATIEPSSEDSAFDFDLLLLFILFFLHFNIQYSQLKQKLSMFKECRGESFTG